MDEKREGNARLQRFHETVADGHCPMAAGLSAGIGKLCLQHRIF
jgi:hypothetical protein